MSKFWKSKKFWFILITLIGIGVFVYFNFFYGKEIITSKEEQEEYYKEDTREPYSQIVSPEPNNWFKNSFQIKVLDEDLNSGIRNDTCQYKVISYSKNYQEVSTGWKPRNCNDYQLISIGPEGDCQFNGRNSCWIYVRCQDKAGNWHTPSETGFSIRSYNIDFLDPEFNQVEIKKKDTQFELQLQVKDDTKIEGCFLYVNGEKQNLMNFQDEDCYNNCSLKKEFSVTGEGENIVFAYCRDLVGNWGKSEEKTIWANTSPIIYSCQAIPSSGKTNSEIKFQVSAEDLDQDKLSYYWDFGDNTTSTEKDSIHQYEKEGVYKPKIIVSDGEKEVSCSTAWVTIEK
jgi:hypothetical protein